MVTLESLPTELTLHIFNHVDVQSLFNLCQTSNLLNSITSDDSLWVDHSNKMVKLVEGHGQKTVHYMKYKAWKNGFGPESLVPKKQLFFKSMATLTEMKWDPYYEILKNLSKGRPLYEDPTDDKDWIEKKVSIGLTLNQYNFLVFGSINEAFVHQSNDTLWLMWRTFCWGKMEIKKLNELVYEICSVSFDMWFVSKKLAGAPIVPKALPPTDSSKIPSPPPIPNFKEKIRFSATQLAFNDFMKNWREEKKRKNKLTKSDLIEGDNNNNNNDNNSNNNNNNNNNNTNNNNDDNKNKKNKNYNNNNVNNDDNGESSQSSSSNSTFSTNLTETTVIQVLENIFELSFRSFAFDMLTIKLGDLTTERLDAIVVANDVFNERSNRLLARTVQDIAGPRLLEECQNSGPHSTPGECFITSGYGLVSRHIIHTVGPMFRDENLRAGLVGTVNSRRETLLSTTVKKCLVLADNHHLETIAFPAMGLASWGYPRNFALLQTVKGILDYLRCCNSQTPVYTKYKFWNELTEETKSSLEKTKQNNNQTNNNNDNENNFDDEKEDSKTTFISPNHRFFLKKISIVCLAREAHNYAKFIEVFARLSMFISDKNDFAKGLLYDIAI